jgi:hypothetical protein
LRAPAQRGRPAHDLDLLRSERIDRNGVIFAEISPSEAAGLRSISGRGTTVTGTKASVTIGWVGDAAGAAAAGAAAGGAGPRAGATGLGEVTTISCNWVWL